MTTQTHNGTGNNIGNIAERIARQCTPAASGASQLACNVVLALIGTDGMARVRSEASTTDGYFAHLCRLVDMEFNPQ